jgi:hypothetical protein
MAQMLNATNAGLIDFASALFTVIRFMSPLGALAGFAFDQFQGQMQSFRDSFQADLDTARRRRAFEKEQEEKNRDPFSNALDTLGDVKPKEKAAMEAVATADNRLLRDIAQNTAATARALERQILGGSEIGKSLTPAEIAALSQRGQPTGRGNIISLERAFTDFARQNR